MPDPRAMTLPPAPSGVAERPVVRETARHVALTATREASTRGPLADAAGALAAPSAELAWLLGRLRSTVANFVRQGRERGLPVERVLSEVKGLVREASALDGWFDPADTLMAQVVGWTIMAYCDEPELAHAPRVC